MHVELLGVPRERAGVAEVELQADTLGQLLVALAVWCAAYAWELSAVSAAGKILALKVKYLGVLMMPVAWAGFILDFVARDVPVTRRVVVAIGTMSACLLVLAWTDGSHHLFWGGLRLEGQGASAVLVGRGPGFWTNITLTYASLVAGIAVLVSQAAVVVREG